nr:MAG TPA: hypothetical protein [Caudoviricetes sp.]
MYRDVVCKCFRLHPYCKLIRLQSQGIFAKK